LVASRVHIVHQERKCPRKSASRTIGRSTARTSTWTKRSAIGESRGQSRIRQQPERASQRRRAARHETNRCPSDATWMQSPRTQDAPENHPKKRAKRDSLDFCLGSSEPSRALDRGWRFG